MLLSAEVRWFWQGHEASLHEWFTHTTPTPGGGETRVDTYLLDSTQTELGIKVRGSKPGLEIKALVSQRGLLTLGSLRAVAQIWTKVPSTALDLKGRPLVSTSKVRWIRKYDTCGSTIRQVPLGKDEQPLSGEKLPDDGCNVELTTVWLNDPTQVWTTLGFEAFGTLERIDASLTAALRHLGMQPFASVGPARDLSYPAWLASMGSH